MRRNKLINIPTETLIYLILDKVITGECELNIIQQQYEVLSYITFMIISDGDNYL